MEDRKLIFISNDDGINARGIKVLTEIAKPYGDVIVVAPETGQSGKSHSISTTNPLRIRKVKNREGIEKYSVYGTPVDCVKLAITEIFERTPDIMLSGINHGSNAAINVIYSGTMAAAIEASLLGINSIGFSIDDHKSNTDFTVIEKHAHTIIENVLKNGLPKQVCLNINFPKTTEAEFKGYKICRQTVGVWRESFIKRIDPFGNDYYWYAGNFQNFEPDNDSTDIWAIENNYAAIVPVKADLTSYDFFNELKTWKL